MDKFDELTATMDLPENRRRDWPWLFRNMWIRNSGHPNFEEAQKIVRFYYKEWMQSLSKQ